LGESDEQELGPQVRQKFPGDEDDKPQYHEAGMVGRMMEYMINESQNSRTQEA
jgi:hypothetical protein